MILESAAQVFVRDGFAAATTERIAERAGVSVGSLYQYWSNKEAIAVSLMERHGEACLARVGPALAALGDPTTALEGRVEALMRALVGVHDDPDLHWILDSEAGVPRLYRERIGEFSARIARHLQDALALTADAALVVACALEAMPHALIRPNTRLDPEATVRELTRLVVGYVAASSGEEGG